MESTSVVALSQQGVLRRQMEIVANNLANMNTTGFKGEKMMFVQHVVNSRGGERLLGDKITYVRDLASVRDLSEGPIEQTGNPLDLAIHGEGYFPVQTPQGVRYTRNGSFQLDATGQVVTKHGFPLLSDGGQPFTVATGEKGIEVARDGSISTSGGSLGRVGVVTFDKPYEVEHLEGGLMGSKQVAKPVTDVNVVQHALEGSNVQPIIELTRMIEVNRSYTSAKKLVENEDERIKKMIKDMVG